MEVIKIKNPNKVGKKTIEEIADYITSGRVVILPTRTIYGISCKYDNEELLDRVYEIKKRDKNLPFIILISDITALGHLVKDINPQAKVLIDNYWNKDCPDSLTLIFKKNKSLNPFITSGSTKIAIRRAGLKFLRQIIDICGPIISTSATISGQKIAPTSIKHIPLEVKKKVDLIVECQTSFSGVESTILDITTVEPALIREGEIKYKEILNKVR